jgi:hypothetical protein
LWERRVSIEGSNEEGERETNSDGRDSGKLRVDVGRDGELKKLPLFLRDKAR